MPVELILLMFVLILLYIIAVKKSPEWMHAIILFVAVNVICTLVSTALILIL